MFGVPLAGEELQNALICLDVLSLGLVFLMACGKEQEETSSEKVPSQEKQSAMTLQEFKGKGYHGYSRS